MPFKNTFTLAFQCAGILILSLALGSCSTTDSVKKDAPFPNQAQKDRKEKPNTREVTIPLEKARPAKNSLPEELTEIQPSLSPREQEAKGVRFTMSARGVSIKNVLFALSQEIEQSIIIGPEISDKDEGKKATVDLKDVTLIEALDSLLPPLRLTYKIDEKFIRVLREEMQTRTFYLNYVISRRVGSSKLSSSSGTSASGSGDSGSDSSSSSSSDSDSDSESGDGNSRSTSTIEASEETDLWTEIRNGLKFIVTPSASTAKGGSTEESSGGSSESGSSKSSGGGSNDLIASLLGGGDSSPSSAVEGTSDDEENLSSSSEDKEPAEKGFLVINKQAGMIVVKDYPDVLLEVAEYLEAIEGSVQRQVFIQAKIVEVTLNDDYQLGINWGDVSPFTITHAGGLSSLAASALTGTAEFSYGLAKGNFSVVVDALSKQGQVSVLSSPKIATLNNQRAVIKVGTEDIFFTREVTAATDSTAAVTEFIANTVTIGIVLDVVPQINPNGQIMMSINTSITEKSGESTTPDNTLSFPILDVRETNNVVLAQHGQTIIIGGLMKTRKEVDNNSVPLLGAIPYIGDFFHWDQETEAKTELVIMLTPEIMAGRAIDNKYRQASSKLRDYGYDAPTDRMVNPSFKR
jgi:MSHA biogenesis protein MshL